jgi:predicted kinase
MEAIILAGLQGAGKSTFCRDRYWDSHVRINYDMLRTRHRERRLLETCLDLRLPLVVDATNPTSADRTRYIGPCRRAGYRIIGVQFRVDLALALARNAGRVGKAQVPEIAIRATGARFEPLNFAEGFEEIWLADVSAAGVRLCPQTPSGRDPPAVR